MFLGAGRGGSTWLALHSPGPPTDIGAKVENLGLFFRRGRPDRDFPVDAQENPSKSPAVGCSIITLKARCSAALAITIKMRRCTDDRGTQVHGGSRDNPPPISTFGMGGGSCPYVVKG